MSLNIPVVAVEPGPQYAFDVNNCLTVIDGHNHTPGLGVAIPTNGLNINSDLTFNNVNATNLRSVRFQPQSAVLSAPTDLGCLYESGVDLYYNDGAGNMIRITQTGGIAGTPGSIANLTPPASASYVALSSTFVFQSDVNTPANIDLASVVLRNLVANSHSLTLSPPSAMGSDTTITLPAVPATLSFVTIDASGAMGTAITPANLVDGITIQEIGNVISVRNDYITYEFKLNGKYATLAMPANNIDGLCFFNFAATIVNAWAYIGTPGSGGTTTMDLKITTAPGGSFASIFSTLPSFTSAAVADAYVDAHSVVAPGTGVTAPVLSTTNIAAGSAMRFDITSVQSGAAAQDCGIVIQFKQG